MHMVMPKPVMMVVAVMRMPFRAVISVAVGISLVCIMTVPTGRGRGACSGRSGRVIMPMRCAGRVVGLRG